MTCHEALSVTTGFGFIAGMVTAMAIIWAVVWLTDRRTARLKAGRLRKGGRS